VREPRNRLRRSLVVGAFIGGALGLVPGASAAAATTFTVSGTADGAGSCGAPSQTGIASCTTLRAAIAAANGETNSPTIQLGAGTYQLTAAGGGQLMINAPMTITGAGAGGPAGTTIEQTDGVDRVLYIGAAPGSAWTVTLSRLEITGGHLKPAWAPAAGADGGGIDALANLILEHVLVTRNEVIGALAHNGMDGDFAAGGGLAIAAPGASRISDSVISHNGAFGGDGGFSPSGAAGAGVAASGGGIAYSGGGSLLIGGTTIAGNKAAGGTGGLTTTGTPGKGGAGTGGGIWSGSPVTVTSSTITRNIAVGGVAPAGATSGGGLGGGIDDEQTTAVVVNSTVFANGAQAPGPGASAEGGGIRAAGPLAGLTLASDTVEGNQSTGTAGNVRAAVGAAFAIEDTIVAGGSPANCDFSLATSVLAEGHNLEDDAARTCQFTPANHDLVGESAQLPTKLAQRGGSTDTLVPAIGSPVLGAGGACLDPTTSPPNQPLTVDQRGLPRRNPCDIGAVEPQPPGERSLPVVSGMPVVGASLTCSQGTWTGEGPLAFADQWLRDGVPIAGATRTGYRPLLHDAGHRLACRVTSTHYGSTSAISAAVTVAPAVIVTRVRANRGAAVVRLACIGVDGESCRGYVALLARRSGRTPRAKVANVKYSIHAQRGLKLTIKLKRRLLRRPGGLRVSLVVVQRVGPTSYVVATKRLKLTGPG
jgi:hypothetical protein